MIYCRLLYRHETAERERDCVDEGVDKRSWDIQYGNVLSYALFALASLYTLRVPV
jgi:cob(I)alamin adenosyltransferase